eukprot:scaffold10248_cov65-Phaeocystis_antarctica.AAC.4
MAVSMPPARTARLQKATLKLVPSGGKARTVQALPTHNFGEQNFSSSVFSQKSARLSLTCPVASDRAPHCEGVG